MSRFYIFIFAEIISLKLFTISGYQLDRKRHATNNACPAFMLLITQRRRKRLEWMLFARTVFIGGRNECDSTDCWEYSGLKTLTSVFMGNAYQHHKGKFYLVIGVVNNCTNDEAAIVYVPLYGNCAPCSRTIGNFMGNADNGQRRFKYLCRIDILESRLQELAATLS